jgi:hypothetical protein
MDIQLHRVIQYFPKHVEENLGNVHSLHLTNECRQLIIILYLLDKYWGILYRHHPCQ